MVFANKSLYLLRNDLFAVARGMDYKSNSFPPPLYVCGVGVWCVQYILYVYGLSLGACVCLSVPVGVVSVLFDSLILSLLPLSLLSCLQSSVGSTLLFRLKVRSSARQADSQIPRLFWALFFKLCAVVER